MTVDRLKALPEVSEVYRKMNVRVPAVSRYDGAFFGSQIRMGLEILAVGVDPGLVRSDVQLGDFQRFRGGIVSNDVEVQAIAVGRVLDQRDPGSNAGLCRVDGLRGRREAGEAT